MQASHSLYLLPHRRQLFQEADAKGFRGLLLQAAEALDGSRDAQLTAAIVNELSDAMQAILKVYILSQTKLEYKMVSP